MIVAMSGATGFVGKNLTKALEAKGWTIRPLTREDLKKDSRSLAMLMSGVNIVINLAGAPIAARWTEEYKKELYDSRIGVTRKIVAALAEMKSRPRLLVSTSAIGIYDSSGEQTEENARFDDGFLGRLSVDWEREAEKVQGGGVRLVIFRFGIVLGRDGGALKKMLVPFRLGLGGTIGNGEQAFSWVHLEDLLRVYETVIEDSRYQGVYNLTAPHPTTNRGLTKAIGKALRVPILMRVPEFVLKLQFGEGAKVLLQGQSVVPQRLLQSGFTFRFPTIDEAIMDLAA